MIDDFCIALFSGVPKLNALIALLLWQVFWQVNKHGDYRPQKPYGLLGTGKRGEGDVEVGGEGDYIPIATLSPPE